MIKAPLEVADNVDHLAKSLKNIITISKGVGEALDTAHNDTEIKKVIEQLTKEQKELQRVNTTLNSQIDHFKRANAERDKSTKSTEGLRDAMDELTPAMGRTVSSIQAITKASLAFIATPIGIVIAALGAALFALTAYFKGSEEGQNRLNKIVQVGKAIFEQFMNVVEDIGEALYNAFTNPRQALEDFGNFLKNQIVNRFVGMLELIPNIGKAVGLLFEGKFKEAGKVAGDAIGKVTLGIENATDKIGEFIKRTGEMVEAGINAGNKIANLQAQSDRAERALIVNRAKTELEVAKLRDEAVKIQGEGRRKFIVEAIRLEKALSDAEVNAALIGLRLAQQTLKAHGDDKEAMDAVAKATANVFNARKQAFDSTLRFQKELAALDAKNVDRSQENLMKIVTNEENASKKIFDVKKIELEKKKDFEIAALKFKEEMADKAAEIEKNTVRALQEEWNNHLNYISGVVGTFTDMIGSSIDMLTERQIENIDIQEERATEQYEKDIEMAGDNIAKKTQLENEFAVKKEEFDRKRAAASRKSAIFEKAVNIIMAIINTAKAVTALLATPPLAIAAGIAGAAQVALIATQKIPAYFRGTRNHPGGLARVADKGYELVQEPGKDPKLYTQDTILDLPEHSKVLTNEETRKFLAYAGLRPPVHRSRVPKEIPFHQYFRELNHTIKNKKEIHNNWTKEGLEQAIVNGESRNYMMKKYFN